MPKKTYKYQDQTPDMQSMQAAGNVQPTPGNSLPNTPQAEPVQKEKKAKKPNPLLIVLAVFLILFLLMAVAAIFKSQKGKDHGDPVENQEQEEQEASASASVYQDLIDKVDALEQDLKETDLIDLDLIYPQVDWDLKIDK